MSLITYGSINGQFVLTNVDQGQPWASLGTLPNRSRRCRYRLWTQLGEEKAAGEGNAE